MKSDSQIINDKSEFVMRTIAWRCAYYRANPSRFIEDYIPHLKLKFFQKILLWQMANNTMGYIVACRGLGKTYVVAMFAVWKCILFPHSKVVCASYTYKQGKEILNKIVEDFMPKSSLLRNEIEYYSTSQNEACIRFKNGSILKIAITSESSRGLRSTCLLIDEARLVEQSKVDTILRPMNSSPRERPYVNKLEYRHLIEDEVPQEIYLSSAYYKQSEMFDKVKTFTANMLSPGLSYFVVDFPYQLSIREGILLRQTIENEMSEQTFNEITFSMERCGMFWGSSEDALFDFNVINKQRTLVTGLHYLDYYRENNLRVPDKQRGEVRVLSVDIALMASRKHNNDASALIVHSAVPADGNNYLDNIVYIDTQEGLLTEELGILIMRYFYQYNCDYLVIDSRGVGLPIVDYIMANHYDPVYGQQYSGLNCMNNEALAERCKVPSAPRVIYAVEANLRLNNDMAVALRAGFQNGYINLLIPDSELNDDVLKVRGYSKMNETQQAKLRLPYIQTTFLVGELINLSHEISGGNIKVKEKPGMRKDRYSSLEYGYYFVQQLGLLTKNRSVDQEIIDMIIVKSAKHKA